MDLILVHDATTQRQLTEAGIPASRVRKILHGNFIHFCQPRDLSPADARRSLGLDPEARVILFFGSIEWRKGLDRLIEAFAMVSQEFNDVYLAISGYPNEDFSTYRAQIERLGIRDRVVVNLQWVPFSEMQRYFHAASMVVLPYRRISQSGILQLAYAYERPLVVTESGGIAEAVLGDGTGLVARDSRPAGIAAAIRELLSDPERATRMGRRGRVLAETKYAWSRIASDVVSFYRSICNSDTAVHA
jgi:glycosyltransferase involved in cell wall biosynthesis